MNILGQLNGRQKTVFLTGVLFLLAWMGLHLHQLVGTQNGLIRCSLALILATAILLRRKHSPSTEGVGSPRLPLPAVTLALGLLGTMSAVTGIMFDVEQLRWTGVLCLAFSCIRWALPPSYATDGLFAFALLYWAHPLPTRVFAPLQLGMQKLSVEGAEWFLHVCNVRVVADGYVLYSGFAAYEIPNWCSGMRTATTVLLLSPGLGILRRMRWYECATLAGLALLQAVVLNVLRIAIMVAYTGYGESRESFEYLHNTTGVVVLLSVALVYAEIALWQWFCQQRTIRTQDINSERIRALTEYPPFWRFFVRYRWPLAVAIPVVALAIGLAYKSRPYHRAQMIKDAAVDLRDAGKMEEAEKAASRVHGLVPDDTEWALLLVRLKLIRHKYEEVLAAVDHIPDAGENTATEKSVLRSYSLMALDRMEEAAEIVKQLPEDVVKKDPRANMVLAEWAMRADDTDAVDRYVRTAKRWGPNMRRIRGLYPYLRQRRRWQTIVDTDVPEPFANPAEALAAAEAYMNLDIVPDAGRLAEQAARAWPYDPRVLEPLFFMSLKRGQAKWEQLFAKHLKRCIRRMDNPDEIAGFVSKCFQLSRPDLAWAVYKRIQRLDPSHPMLFLIPARFGHEWFAFRKHPLGISAARASDTIDLKSYYLLGLEQPFWRPFCEEVPIGCDLAVDDMVACRKEFLAKAVEAFRERDRSDSLSREMMYEYVDALEMSGDVAGARNELKRLVELYPADVLSARVALSGIFERQGDWQNVYEVLKDYLDAPYPHLKPCLRLGQAELNLHLSLAAAYTARRAYTLFPTAARAVALLTTCLIRQGRAEEAHEILRLPRPRHQRALDLLETEALYKTQRYAEVQTLARSALLPRVPMPADTSQRHFLIPAEASVLWHFISIPSKRSFDSNARRLEKNLEETTSPFLKSVLSLWLEAYRNPSNTSVYATERWLACGRTPIEQATALNQLTLLHCRNEHFPEARNVAGRAVDLFPESPLLWTILISLSGGDPEVIAAARRYCPKDSEIWLAELVTRAQRTEGGPDEEWLRKTIEDAVRTQVYTPAAMARAAEYLFRGGYRELAAIAADDAVERARGLVPAYIIGIKCALVAHQWDKALMRTEQAVRASLDPPPVLYEKLVGLKSLPGSIDTDREMVDALRNLREQKPDEVLWAQTLGFVRFERGGWEIIDALYQMTDALQGGATNVLPYAVAAESARLLGDNDRAVDLLRKGLKRHPDSLVMLNNLLYSLAYTPDGVEEAKAKVPELLARGTNAPAFLDTAAVVYLRAGELDRAGDVLGRLIARVDEGSREWFRARVHLASIAYRKKRYETASDILKQAMKRTRNIPGEDILEANRLLVEVENVLSERDRKQREPYEPSGGP